MPGYNYNIVPEIGGVDTSDVSRKFTCEEQLDIARGTFGEHVHIPYVDAFLEIGVRSEGKGYSSEAGRLFVANDHREREMLVASTEGLGGFLVTCIGGAANAGRKAIENEAYGERERSPKPSDMFRLRRDLISLSLVTHCLTGEMRDIDVLDEVAFKATIGRLAEKFISTPESADAETASKAVRAFEDYIGNIAYALKCIRVR